MRLPRCLFRSVTRAARVLPLLAAFTLGAGCVGGADNGTGPTTGTITVATTTTGLRSAVGMPVATAVRVTRSAGYTGTVLLSVDSLPIGVTASFSPEVLAGAATTTILTLTTASAAVAGTTTINVRAAGTDLTAASTTVSLTVVLGSFDLTSAATSVAAPQGAAASVPLDVSRTNGFSGQVSLVAEGLPAGVIATFTPALLPSGSTTSTLTLSASAGAVPGPSTVTVRGRSAGFADRTVPILYTIGSAAARDYSVAASAASLRTVAGGSVQTTLLVTRTGGHSDNIQFATSALPAGVTASISPNPVSANSATLTVTTTAAAVPGTYAINVLGVAPASGVGRTIPLSLTIAAMPGIAVALSPAALVIAPGGIAESAILITRIGGFTGDFVMSADGLPAGVRATFSPAPVTGTATILTLSATAAATPGSFSFVVRATAGSDFGAVTVPLTIGTPGTN